jgi:hypothetical protein
LGSFMALGIWLIKEAFMASQKPNSSPT